MTTQRETRSCTDPIEPSSAEARVRANWLGRAPLLFAAGLIFVICGINLVRLVVAEAPRDPWEATEVLEGWRSLRGMPVYELVPDGHSTHVYGALVPWVQGEIFRWVGANNISGRVLSLVSSLALVALLGMTMRGEKSSWALVVAVAVIFGVNNRSHQYFVENRPDMTAMMFATAGILSIALGQERRHPWRVALGIVCLVLGFFFKQTAFIFTPVPLLALALRGRWPLRSELVLATLPVVISSGVILILKVVSPTHYHYMITVHGAFGIDLVRAARCLWDMLIDTPLFLFLFGEWIAFDTRSLQRDPRVRWLIAALAITIPFSSVAAGKIGGASNSLLPALLAMTAFCALRLPKLAERIMALDSSRPMRLMQGAFLALLMVMSTFPHMSRTSGLFVRANSWDREYRDAVALAGRLPGTVVCPEDPTIPLYAKGYAGQNIFSEFDTHLVNGEWPTVPPAALVRHCQSADYLVDVGGYWDLLKDDLLKSMGFEPAPELAPDLSCYRIWRRTGTESISGGSRTAQVESGSNKTGQSMPE